MTNNYLFAFCLFFIVDCGAQIVSIPDANFKARLLEASTTMEIAKDAGGNWVAIDTNGNSEIEVQEAQQVSELLIEQSLINDITGIQNFTNLSKLTVVYNNVAVFDLTGLDNLTWLEIGGNTAPSITLSGAPNLEFFSAVWSYATSLDLTIFPKLEQVLVYQSAVANLNVAGLQYLKRLDINECPLTSLSLQGLTSLEDLNMRSCFLSSVDNFSDTAGTLKLLSAEYNNFSEIDLSGFVALEQLIIANNDLTAVDLSGLGALVTASLEGNQLSSIAFGGNDNLDILFLENNQMTSIDVSGLNGLNHLYCKNNPAVTIFAKNGNNVSIDVGNNQGLQYICTDEDNIQQTLSMLSMYGVDGCMVGSYCTFQPGGSTYPVTIDSHFGTTCDTTPNFPLMRLNFEGAYNANFITDDTGHFAAALPAGVYEVIPVLENPDYFTVSPQSVTITLPGAAPVSEYFCITPISTHKDLEVTLIPISVARPGFDSKYKIVYRNKGNNAQSGTVSFTYQDNLLDYVLAQPVASGQTANTLSWDFTDLMPLEARAILVTLNVNSPVETPPVNIGDELNFVANITPFSEDETPLDNAFGLKQIAVGSMDPNDKTCIEGTAVSPDIIGNEVHYVIRFENTGTFAAENIVVKDIIDTTRFEVNSLVPLHASHRFITRISEGNRIEFIFENIDLPFDDASNDGYVAFKVKTKPSLVVGDTFSNTAAIYFDYNFPVVTNTATTTVQLLGAPDFAFSDLFTIYPNPAINELFVRPGADITISAIELYNIHGQLIMAQIAPGNSMNVKALQAGTYFMRVFTPNGFTTTTFIKQ